MNDVCPVALCYLQRTDTMLDCSECLIEGTEECERYKGENK